MKALTQQEMEEIRQEAADLGFAADRIDGIIELLDAIAASFVYQAFAKSPVQLSLSARANRAFAGDETRDNLQKSNEIETVDLGNEGARNTKRPKRQPAP